MPGYHRDDLPITAQRDNGFCQRATEVAGMTVAFERVPAGEYGDAGACMTPHWGYVFKGRAHVRYADREEFLEAGQAYYLAPGHRIAVLEDSEVVEFSPSPKTE